MDEFKREQWRGALRTAALVSLLLALGCLPLLAVDSPEMSKAAYGPHLFALAAATGFFVWAALGFVALGILLWLISKFIPLGRT